MKNLCGGSSRREPPPAIRISAKYGDGLDRLTAALRDLVLATPAEESPEAMIAHLHQKTALEKASAGLARAREGLLAALPPELVALEVREALNALGKSPAGQRRRRSSTGSLQTSASESKITIFTG